MKKIKFLSLLLVVLATSALSGCKNGNDSQKAELERKIEELEKQIAKLEEKPTNTIAGNSNDADTAGQSTNADTVGQSTDMKTTAPNTVSDTVESLSKDVDEVTAKIDSATPPQKEDEKRTKFFALKDELELVEDRIDAYDDYLESQQKRGSLSYKDYKSQERLLDDLEDKLDASEDKLERTFGIYD